MKRIIFILSSIIILNMLFHCDNIFAENKLLSSDMPTKDSSILTANDVSIGLEDKSVSDEMKLKYFDERAMSGVGGYRILPIVKSLTVCEPIKINGAPFKIADCAVCPVLADDKFIGFAYFSKMTIVNRVSFKFIKYDFFSQSGLDYLNSNKNAKLYIQPSKFDSFDDAIFAVSNNNRTVLLNDLQMKNYNAPSVNYPDLKHSFNLSEIKPINLLDFSSYDNDDWHFTAGEKYYISNGKSYLTYENGKLLLKDWFLKKENQCFQQFILNDKGSGVIEIIPQANLNNKLDITNAQSKNGTLVKTYVNNPKYHYAQEFKLVYQNGRIPSYKIVSLISDKEKKVIYDANFNKLVISDCKNNDNENWQIIKVCDNS